MMMHEPDDYLRKLFAIADLEDLDQEADRDSGKPDTDAAEPPASAVQSPVSLMITRRQRVDLRTLGYTDEAIALMTPAEAHGHLGL